MDDARDDQMVILIIKRSASAARLTAAGEALKRDPSNAELIANVRRAQWDADYANKKVEDLVADRDEDARRDARHERWIANEATDRILLWLLAPAFLLLVGTGPIGAVFWSKDYRQLVHISDGNDFAFTSVAVISVGSATATVWLIAKVIRGPIYDRIIAAKKRRPRP